MTESPKLQQNPSPAKSSNGDIVALGIDLGTTNSCICAYGNNRRIDVIESLSSSSSRSVPSVVSFINGECRVGEEALKTQLLAPKSTYNLAKRFIGKKVTDHTIKSDASSVAYDVILDYEDPVTHEKDDRPRFGFYEKDYDITQPLFPEEISAILLKHLYNYAQVRTSGEEIKDVVITVPANFNDYQRRATIDAGIFAGFNVLSVITEPTAAAIAYANNAKEMKPKELVMVFDFGGGTLDVSVLQIENFTFTVLATDGDTNCGGSHIDRAIYEIVTKEYLEKYNIDIEKNDKIKVSIMRQCELAKKSLSSSAMQFTFNIEMRPEQVKITKETLKRICRNMEKQILKPIDNVLSILEKENKSKDSIDTIIAVGGSSSIPFIMDIVQKHMNGKEINKPVDPAEAIAIGASIYGAYLKLKDKPTAFKNNIVIKDVVPMALGIGIPVNRVINLVPKNAPRPCESTRFNFIGRKGSNVVKIDVYEGDSDKQDECDLIESNTMHDPLIGESGCPELRIFINVTERTYTLTVESGDNIIKKEFEKRNGSHSPQETERIYKDIEELMRYHEKKEEEEEEEEITPAKVFLDFLRLGKKNLLEGKKPLRTQTNKINTIIKNYRTWANKHLDADQETVDKQMENLKNEIRTLFKK